MNICSRSAICYAIKVLWRKDKIGFVTPERKWVLENKNKLKDYMEKKNIKKYSGYKIWRMFLADKFINQCYEA